MVGLGGDFREARGRGELRLHWAESVDCCSRRSLCSLREMNTNASSFDRSKTSSQIMHLMVLGVLMAADDFGETGGCSDLHLQ